MGKKPSANDHGPSQRQLRVGELIRRSLTEILMRGDVFDRDLARLSVIVTEARSSRDLRTVTVYISTLGGKDDEKALAALRRNAKALRRQAVDGLTLKFAPDLIFEIDRSFDRMDETKRLLADPRVRQDVEREDGDDTLEDEGEAPQRS